MSNTIQKRSVGRHFPRNYPVAPPAGDTEDEAIQNAKEALELWFEPAAVDLPAGAKIFEVALT